MKRLVLLLLALVALPAAAQTYTNMPISCARANGLQADAAACTDTEQRQQPALADDVVLACTKATPCGWYDAELTWRKWSTVPDTATVVVCPLLAAPGAMSCPGASSPIWGGLVPVAKAQVAVASAVLPPLASGENYVVTWTQPTKKTDGTPIGTITKTEVQASLTPGFVNYYSWNATTPGATSVSVVNGPAGKVYWRARVFAGAGGE